MRFVIGDQVVLSRAPDGPIAAYISAFAKSQSKQGYAAYSIHRQVLLAARFSRWLKQEGVPLCHISSDHPSRYLRHRARRVRPCPGGIAAPRHLINKTALCGRPPGPGGARRQAGIGFVAAPRRWAVLTRRVSNMEQTPE